MLGMYIFLLDECVCSLRFYCVGKLHPTMMVGNGGGRIRMYIGKNNKIDLIEITKRRRSYRYSSMNGLSYLRHALRVLFQLLLQGFHPVGFLAE